jgi:hypothetical protein
VEVERLEGLVRAASSKSFAPSARHSGGWDRCLITSRGDPPGRRRRGSAALLLAASAALQRAAGVLPEAFRQRYAAEMRSDFFEHVWEGLQEGDRRSSREWGVGETMLAPMRVSCSPVPFSTSCHLPTASIVRDDQLDTAPRVYWGAERLRSCSKTKSGAKVTQKRDR